MEVDVVAGKAGEDDVVEVGVSAQSVQEVLPEVVELAPFDRDSTSLTSNVIISKSGQNYLSVAYENIVPLLVESVKDLKRKLDDLKQSDHE